MTDSESLYFDLVRVVAALTVLIGHSVLILPHVMPMGDYGHFAVDAFFVLSGYVIAFVTDTKERAFRRFLVSRAARIYSVAAPAIAVTLACDFIGLHASGASLYLPYPESLPAIRVASVLTFTNELWFVSIIPFSNGPFWSLCYEVWYYAIYAAAIYAPKSMRTPLVVLFCAIAGPKILLLFPIWLLGVGLYYFKPKLALMPALLLFLASLIALIALLRSSFVAWCWSWLSMLAGGRWFSMLEFSHQFPADYIVGLIVAANFFAVRSFDGVRLERFPRAATVIRWASASTFSIYLFHKPVLQMILSLMGRPTDYNIAFVAVFLTAIAAVGLSYISERRKQEWRKFFDGVLPHTIAVRRSVTP